jgi:hypothetical protein
MCPLLSSLYLGLPLPYCPPCHRSSPTQLATPALGPPDRLTTPTYVDPLLLPITSHEPPIFFLHPLIKQSRPQVPSGTTSVLFSHPDEQSFDPATRSCLPFPRTDPVQVFICGVFANDLTTSARAGGGLWFAPDGPCNRSLCVLSNPLSHHSPQSSLRCAPPHQCDLHVVSDSHYVVPSLTEHLRAWEGRNVTEAITSLLRARSGSTVFHIAYIFDSLPGGLGARMLAQEGLLRDQTDILPTGITRNFRTNGVRLNVMTQSLLYQGILRLRAPLGRASTLQCLSQVQSGVESRAYVELREGGAGRCRSTGACLPAIQEADPASTAA